MYFISVYTINKVMIIIISGNYMMYDLHEHETYYFVYNNTLYKLAYE